MSVTPDDRDGLPQFLTPQALGGTGKNPVWEITSADLGPDLAYRPDPRSSTHGLIEPAREMAFQEYVEALCATKSQWKPI
jgi:hypothetical protein